jgi:hypothetical protein
MIKSPSCFPIAEIFKSKYGKSKHKGVLWIMGHQKIKEMYCLERTRNREYLKTCFRRTEIHVSMGTHL